MHAASPCITQAWPVAIWQGCTLAVKFVDHSCAAEPVIAAGARGAGHAHSPVGPFHAPTAAPHQFSAPGPLGHERPGVGARDVASRAQLTGGGSRGGRGGGRGRRNEAVAGLALCMGTKVHGGDDTGQSCLVAVSRSHLPEAFVPYNTNHHPAAAAAAAKERCSKHRNCRKPPIEFPAAHALHMCTHADSNAPNCGAAANPDHPCLLTAVAIGQVVAVADTGSAHVAGVVVARALRVVVTATQGTPHGPPLRAAEAALHGGEAAPHGAIALQQVAPAGGGGDVTGCAAGGAGLGGGDCGEQQGGRCPKEQ